MSSENVPALVLRVARIRVCVRGHIWQDPAGGGGGAIAPNVANEKVEPYQEQHNGPDRLNLLESGPDNYQAIHPQVKENRPQPAALWIPSEKEHDCPR
jgi:hypothetical protein